MKNLSPIQIAVAKHFDLKVEDVRMGGSRHPKIVIARHVAWYLERQRGVSFSEIAAMYNCGDHTTVLCAMNSMRERLEKGDERYSVPIAALIEMVQSAEERVAAVKAENDAATKALIISEAAKLVFDNMSCPTCGAPVITELQRQIAILCEQVEELKRSKT